MNQPNSPLEVSALDGERPIPSVNERSGSKARKVLIVVLMGVFFVILLALVVFKMQSKSAPEKKQRNAEQTSALPARTFTAPVLPGADAKPAEVVPVVRQVEATPVQQPGLPGESAEKPVAKLDKSASSLMVATTSSSEDRTASQQPGSEPYAGTYAGNKLGQQNATDGGPLGGLLTGTKTDARMATMLGNRNFILAKGSFIDCALQTRLDSTVPGMTACVVTRNIYSDNGKVLLVDRGSTVTGEYQANMKQGMARIYVLWTRIKTPNGVVVNLDSPGADPLGGAGVPGYVNNHFWKRFGGALMLSLVDDVAQAATQQTSSNNSQINFNSTGEATTDMASVALQNTINIPPTLYKNQGEQVGIYIARDLDFSGVYDVQPK